MGVSTISYKPQLSTGAKSEKTTNLVINLVNTEFSLLLQPGLRKLIIVARTSAKLQYSFTALASGTVFNTIKKGTSRTLSELEFTGKTLYIQSDTLVTLEIEEFFT